LRLARETLERLSTSMTTVMGIEPPGRMVRLLEHWRTVTAHCQRAVEQVHAEREVQARQRRRLWAMAVGTLLVCTTAVGLAVRSWFLPARAAERTVPPSTDDLAQLVTTLPGDLREGAAALLAQTLPARQDLPLDYRTWHDGFRRELRAFVENMQARGEPPSARAFAIGCWDAGLAAAGALLDDAGRMELLRLAAELANEPWLRGLQLSTSTTR
jgi:hypothetical protein